MTFSTLDLVFALFVLFFALSAMHAGFLNELLGKLAVIFGVIGGVFLSPVLAPYLIDYVKVGILAAVLSFMLVFSGVFLAVKILQVALHGLLSRPIIKALDSALGFMLGGIEGILLVSVFLIALNAQPWFNGKESLLKGSVFWHYLEPYLQPAIDFVSARLVIVGK